jgi:hypothetical protein
MRRRSPPSDLPSHPSTPPRTPQIFRLSVWAGRATPGSELMNLRYRDEAALAAAERAAAGGGAGPSGRGGAAPAWVRGRGVGGTGPWRCMLSFPLPCMAVRCN